MRVSILLSAVAAAVVAAEDGTAADGPTTGALGNATVQKSNPGAVYFAKLPETAFDKAAYPDGGNAKGAIMAEPRPDGPGVVFEVQFSHLPETGGPFTYHIHAKPVPSDGNCTAAGGHLDPFQREDDPPCDSKLKQTCEVGDLSGKYGKITSDPFNATYLDLYTSTDVGNPAFFGNLSFVLHYANKTRISCANFALQAGNSTTGTGTSTGTTGTGVPTKSVQPYATASAAVSAAAGRAVRTRIGGVSVAGIMAVAAAVML